MSSGARRSANGGLGIPQAGRHGGDGPAIAAALGLDPDAILDLSLTLNPFAPDVAAIAARHLRELRRYPDPAAATGALADAIGVDHDRLLLTAGGSEAIALVARELGGTVAAEPEFALHPRDRGDARWRSDPHNPTGRLATPEDQADVWDEAFYPLATGRWTGARRGVVVGSLTKLLACPGLRLGYVLADDIERFARHQAHWAVSSLALAVLLDALPLIDLGAWAAAVTGARRDLVGVLAKHGLPTEPSDAPWVLVRAPGLRDRLAPAGVVVRDCTSFRMPEHARVAITDADELERLDRALAVTS